uniref:DUF5672 domain-containing protein n=1 Tax=viral metagenome TaxID=1070528 RepID=A0A6C0BBW2_9ZZZZ
MKIKNIYQTTILNNFLTDYNTTKERLSSNHHIYFRYLCFKYIDFIRLIDIPRIKQDLNCEAVLIEYRKFPHVEFLIRNTILKLGNKWSYSVVCGTENYHYMLELCNKISSNIRVIETPYSNLNQSEYSKFLTTTDFWNLLKGEKILIYQEDSIIFNNFIKEFLEFDFIGAPFPKSQNDTPNNVGNGGFSIRSKTIMKKIIETISVESTQFNSSTIEYMKNINLTFPPEDIYFSKNMQELKIGTVADWNDAFMFSSESICNTNSFGGHKFWVSNPSWKKLMNATFDFKPYKFNNDIKKYIAFKNLPLDFDKTSKIENAFDVDLYFCNNVNKLHMKNDSDILHYIKNICLNGYVYHPKQVKNIYPDIKIYNFMNDIIIEHNSILYKASNFVEQHLYQKNFDELSKNLIKRVYSNLNDKNDVLLLVFIGNETVGKTLLEKVIKYKKIQEFNIAICFNSYKISKSLKLFIKDNFTNYCIYISNEMGTDITPTMLLYNHIASTYKFKHIIKLHTKSIVHLFNELTDFLLSVPIQQLLEYKQDDCNCIGHPHHYAELKNDPWVKISLINNSSYMDLKKKFVAGTIFYADNSIFDAVLQFIKKKSSNSYLLNNLYENNSINSDFSPIHFLERVFGIVYL